MADGLAMDKYEDTRVTTIIETVGQLTAAREARGLSENEVAGRLRLAPRQIRALEAGDWASLPGPAFIRAALRSYGRAIDVDVAPLIGSVTELAREPELHPTASLHEPMPRRGMLGFGAGGSGNRLAWIALVVLALVVLALYFANDGERSRVPSWFDRATPPVAEQPAAAPAEAPAEPAPPADAAPTASGTGSSVPGTAPLAAPAPAAPPEAAR